MENVTIYHGSPNIVTPVFGEGKDYNDYGQGFYCTENLELAKEEVRLLISESSIQQVNWAGRKGACVNCN